MQSINDKARLATESFTARLMDASNKRFEEIAGALKYSSAFEKMHQQIEKSVSDTLARYNTSLADKLSAAFDIQSRYADLSGFAERLQQITDRTQEATALWSNVISKSKELAEVEDSDTELNTRDVIFAVWDGEECLPDQRAAREELEKIPDFRQLPPNTQLAKIFEAAKNADSVGVRLVLLDVAVNLLAGLMGQNSGGLWFVLVLLLIFIIPGQSKAQLPEARRLLRNAPIDKKNTRLVDYPCIVYVTPKPKAQRLGCLDQLSVVLVTDRFQGWRQIYFVDGAGQQRVGWVRSKYLRRV